MAGHPGELEELQHKLAGLLPDSIQVFNLVTLALSGDGIARQVIALDEGGKVDTLAVIVLNKIEAPKESISLYYNTLGAGNMKKLLIENVDLKREITFAVSCKYQIHGSELLYVKAVNQLQKELILSLGYDTSNWIFETVGWSS